MVILTDEEVFISSHPDGVWQLQKAYRLLVPFFNGSKIKADLWLETDNPMLGGISPYLMVEHGQGKRLLDFIEYSISLNKPDGA